MVVKVSPSQMFTCVLKILKKERKCPNCEKIFILEVYFFNYSCSMHSYM